ncbi:MAG: DNA mismatch repair endonuclease MutL [Clostridiales bacterium]|nr:DNA mismatch repair endonuclease MutL [Clostridiales bacterium]
MNRKIQPIHILTQDVVGKIAAGEVVERPAAAVKELVENAIDADATAITIELTDGGITSIRVSDNGTGIPAGQMKMAFERHATNKLTTAEDLFRVQTLGFRGEALASIAAVSKVTCTSKTADAEYGMKAQVEAGVFTDFREAANPVGTAVTVRELFFNAPVRLKFLKKPSAEAALVSDYLLRLILSRPDIAFRFSSQEKTVYRSAGDGKLESAIYAVYGKDAAQAMRKVSGNFSGVLIDGYVGVQDLARGNRQQQSFFINGRYIRDDVLSRALEAAAEGFVMIGRFPICALNLTMPYEQVDVNVHPNKLEVRFQNPKAVAEAVEAVVRGALNAETIADKLSPLPDPPKSSPPPIEVVQWMDDTETPYTPQIIQSTRQVLREPSQAFLDDADAHEPVPAESEAVQEAIPGTEETVSIRYIGAAFKTYLLFEAGEKLLLIDQHAAHERVLYDRFMQRYQGEAQSQRLMTPMLLPFTANDISKLSEMKEELEAIGFTLDVFDATTVAVRATPVILGDAEPVRELLIDVLDNLRGKPDTAMRERMKTRVAQMACKHAIKGGDTLSQADVEALIRQMLETGVQPTCPHGRPIVQEMTRREMEKRFRRIP